MRFKKISWCFSFYGIGTSNFYNENDIFMTWSIQKLYFDPKFKSFLTEFWLGAFQGQVNIYSYWRTFFYTWDWCKYFDHWRSSKFRYRPPEISRFWCNFITSGSHCIISGRNLVDIELSLRPIFIKIMTLDIPLWQSWLNPSANQRPSSMQSHLSFRTWNSAFCVKLNDPGIKSMLPDVKSTLDANSLDTLRKS